MPMNTAGFDCRAPRIMGDWMVGLAEHAQAGPARNAGRRGTAPSEDALPGRRRPPARRRLAEHRLRRQSAAVHRGSARQRRCTRKALDGCARAARRIPRRRSLPVLPGRHQPGHLRPVRSRSRARVPLSSRTRTSTSSRTSKTPPRRSDASGSVRSAPHRRSVSRALDRLRPDRSAAALGAAGGRTGRRSSSMASRTPAFRSGMKSPERARGRRETQVDARRGPAPACVMSRGRSQKLTSPTSSRSYATTEKPFGLWKVKPECEQKLAPRRRQCRGLPSPTSSPPGSTSPSLAGNAPVYMMSPGAVDLPARLHQLPRAERRRQRASRSICSPPPPRARRGRPTSEGGLFGPLEMPLVEHPLRPSTSRARAT